MCRHLNNCNLGSRRSHCEAGHVVPCLFGGSEGVCAPLRPQPGQPILPWACAVWEQPFLIFFYRCWIWKLATENLKIWPKEIVLVSYIGGSYSGCSVQIRVVKLSDAGDYHFRFETDQPLGRWTSPNTVRLDVTGICTQAETAESSPLRGSLPPCSQRFSPYTWKCVLRPPGSGAPGKALQHVRLGRDRVCRLSGQRLRCSREEPRAVQVCLIYSVQLSYRQCSENSAAVVWKVGALVFVNNTRVCTSVESDSSSKTVSTFSVLLFAMQYNQRQAG